MKITDLSDEVWAEIERRSKTLNEKQFRPATEVILDDVDLRDLLKISRRTSLEYRKKKVYPYYKLENKIFYILAEVIEGIKKGGSNEN